MRLADGGTYNVLAEECELGVRNLKDHLLSAFGNEPNTGDLVEFFVAEQRRYSLKRLRIDEQNVIRPGG
jgi:lipase chaperone LimK